jgi:polyribonucleotide nucleotidyltransferase
MLDCIPTVSEKMSDYAPKILTFKIDPDKIGDVVGKQGKVINKIIEQTGTKVDIEDDGTVCVACYGDVSAAKRAQAIIESIAHDPEVGDMFVGVVARVLPIGAIVEFAPGKSGMIHISKLADRRVEKVEDVVNVGDKVKVEIIKIGEKGIDFKLLEKLA